MKVVLKLTACWGVFALSLLAAGLLARSLHLQLIPAGTNLPLLPHLSRMLVAAAVLTSGLAPLARGLSGPAVTRCAAIALFLFLALGVNTLLDAAIFAHVFDCVVPGHILSFALQSLFLGAALGLCFGLPARTVKLPRLTIRQWVWRAAVAWIAWPLIYLFFGICVAPIVIPYYQNHSLPGFHIPTPQVILTMQLVRSLVFLAATLPLVALWRGSRRGLWLSLGCAHTVTVALFGLIAATFLPALMRLAHGAEMTADAFAYTGLLVLLFAKTETSPETAAVKPKVERMATATSK
jgi:hypothetical protein